MKNKSDLSRRSFLRNVVLGGLGGGLLSVGVAAAPAATVSQKRNGAGGSLFPKKRKTPLPGGYMGKILRVNLTTGKITTENLPEEPVLRKWIGGKGLGEVILHHELPPGVSPLSPENPLIFMTGPLTGTGLTPAGTKYVVTTLNYETGFTLGNGRASGFWGPLLKFSGYDGVIVNGASKKPVYLWVNEGKAELRDASKIWGKDSHETEDLVKKDVGQPGASVLTIGPAGENLVSFAMILNDYNHTAAHSGVGGIMGSKKLKAMAVYGTKMVPVKDEAKLTEAGNRWRSKLRPYTVESRFRGGTPETFGVAPAKNWQTTILKDLSKDFNTQKITLRPCYGCIRSCPYDAELTIGPHAGHVCTMGAGGENMEGAAYIFGIGGNEVRYLTDIYDRIGIEASGAGNAIALAIECYEKGLLTKKDTDGLELRWNDPELIEKLAWKVGKREGWLGRSCALGAKRLAELIGGDAPKFAVHIKGAAPNLHEWRPWTATMLGQITGSGAGWPGSGFDMRSGAPDLGYPKPTDRATQKGKAEELFAHTLGRNFWENVGVCWFGTADNAEGMFKDAVDALAATTGWKDLTLEECLASGERSWQLERIFNIQHGLKPEDDYQNIGPRFLEPVPDGQYKGFTIAKWLPGLVFDFYRACGWDERTGKPYRDTLQRLGIEEYAV